MGNKTELDILYVEDEREIREAVSLGIEAMCGSVRTATDGVDALRMIREQCPDVVVTDIRMPLMDGLELTAQLGQEFPALPVIITTAFTEVDYLLRAIKLGVKACIRKPINYGELTKAIRDAGEPALLRRQLEKIKAQTDDALLLKLGYTPHMRRVAAQVTAISDSNFSIMIQGESGVGKMYLAGLIHDMSERRRKPYFVVCCDSVAPELLERELFGFKNWGYGKLRVAAESTLILQHIDAMPLTLQRKLQRAIEEKTFLPAGEEQSVPLEIRLITTLTGSIEEAKAAGRLDEALCYALSDQIIDMPPLRTIPDEIIRLATLFLADAVENQHQKLPQINEAASAFLKAQPWFGNIRELRTVMRRLSATDRTKISTTTLKSVLSKPRKVIMQTVTSPASLNIEELERWAIVEALEKSGGRKMQAATILGLDYKRFKRKLEKYGFNSAE